MILKIFGILVLVILYVIMNTMIYTRMQNQKRKSYAGIILKIFVNYFHHLSIVSFGGQSLALPSFKFAFDIPNYLGLLNEDVFSNDCFLYAFYKNYENFYTVKMVIILIMPFVFSMLLVFLFVALAMRSEIKKKSQD